MQGAGKGGEEGGGSGWQQCVVSQPRPQDGPKYTHLSDSVSLMVRDTMMRGGGGGGASLFPAGAPSTTRQQQCSAARVSVPLVMLKAFQILERGPPEPQAQDEHTAQEMPRCASQAVPPSRFDAKTFVGAARSAGGAGSLGTCSVPAAAAKLLPAAWLSLPLAQYPLTYSSKVSDRSHDAKHQGCSKHAECWGMRGTHTQGKGRAGQGGLHGLVYESKAAARAAGAAYLQTGYIL